MNVSLTPELEQYINDKVASGRYASASEVVREALRLHEEREKKLAALRADIEAGLRDIEQGRVHEATPEFWEELKREIAERADALRHQRKKAS